MKKSSPLSMDGKIAKALLQAVVRKGWDALTLDDVAKQTKIAPSVLKKRFASKHEVVSLAVSYVTREALLQVLRPTGSPRDILFDLLMARFDVLQKDRKAVLILAGAAHRDKELGRTLAVAVWKELNVTLDAAALHKLPRVLSAFGLSAVYGVAFWTWSKDETRDMSKTMASLDRALSWAERVAEFI